MHTESQTILYNFGHFDRTSCTQRVAPVKSCLAHNRLTVPLCSLGCVQFAASPYLIPCSLRFLYVFSKKKNTH